MAGRHDWHSFEDYCRITENVLERHAFVERENVAIEGPFKYADQGLYFRVSGTVHCRRACRIVLTTYLDARHGRHGLEVRVRTFRYQALRGRTEILRYDNATGLHKYHMHRWDFDGSVVVDHAALTREQMPHLSEVLDELQALTGL